MAAGGWFALYSYYRETGEKEILHYLTGWFDSKLDGAFLQKNVNTMCPMLTLSYLAEEIGRTDYLKLCREWHSADPDFSLTHAADSFAMNTKSLSRIFKEEIGENFVDYWPGCGWTRPSAC
jgi:hypothetical protein